MIYIRNISNKIIHLGETMLLPAPPNDKTPDEKKDGTKYSDSPIIQQFINMNLLELVDVRPLEKKVADKKEIKVEFDENLEPEEATEAESKPEETEKETAEEEKPKTTTRRKKTQPEG